MANDFHTKYADEHMAKKSMAGLNALGDLLEKSDDDDDDDDKEDKDMKYKGTEKDAEKDNDNGDDDKKKAPPFEAKKKDGDDDDDDDMDKCGPGYKKSEGIDALGDYLAKSGGLPTHQQRMGGPKSASQGGSQDGGELAGVGQTSGNPDSAPGPGTDKLGNVKADSPGKQKLSDDDAEDEKQMKPHKKPIEGARKSMDSEAQPHDTVARDVALRKSEVTRPPQDVDYHPYSMAQTHGSSDAEAADLVKSDGFYEGGSPLMAKPVTVLGRGVLCKSCDEVYTSALTCCPHCGDGHVEPRVLPGQRLHKSGVMIEPEQPSLLKRPPTVQDITIGNGGPDIVGNIKG
jgi:hypothetical protein